MCFQNEAPVLEHVFECVLDQHVFKTHWNFKMHSRTCSKQCSKTRALLRGLTHTYNNRVFPGMMKNANIIAGCLQVANHEKTFQLGPN